VNSETIRLKAADGHELDAYLVKPSGRPKAGIVVIQEIFGVTGHIRRVTEQFADLGYLAIAPAFFDRVERGIALDYKDIERGRDIMMKLDLAQVALDVAAAIDAVRSAGKVGVVGYCWGGSVADLAACRTDADAAVSYYGRQMVNWLGEQPRCPVLYHFGRKDFLLPMEIVEQVRAGRPGQEIHVYDEAGHGFNCDERHEYHAPSAALALERTLAFFNKHLQ
jgi:carboxymethylenebutenolidase